MPDPTPVVGAARARMLPARDSGAPRPSTFARTRALTVSCVALALPALLTLACGGGTRATTDTAATAATASRANAQSATAPAGDSGGAMTAARADVTPPDAG